MLNSPFLQSGASRGLTRNAATNLLRTGKFSFNGVISNLEKTVSTINQVVPLYNQVKPLITNSKTLFNAFKSTRNNTKRQTKRNTRCSYSQNINPNIINVNVKENPMKEKKEQQANNFFTSVDTPNKPFFN